MSDEIQLWEPTRLNGALELPPRTVDCWLLNLDRIPDEIAALNDEELKRANRFRFARHRARFIAARNAIRKILGAYTAQKPAEVVFPENDYGRPELSNCVANLTFNHSRSGELGILCIAEKCVLGVDIEELRDANDLVDVAKLNFSRRELVQLEKLSDSDKLEGFYNCWTRKEAVVKATGQGLSATLNDFDVSLTPGHKAAILGARNDLEPAEAWRMRALTPAEGFTAAIVTDLSSPTFRYFRWIPRKS